MVGWQFGGWGLEQYGPNPKAVDAIDFYTARLQQLWLMMAEQQQLSSTQFVPAAFVTFQSRRAQVCPHVLHFAPEAEAYMTLSTANMIMAPAGLANTALCLRSPYEGLIYMVVRKAVHEILLSTGHSCAYPCQ